MEHLKKHLEQSEIISQSELAENIFLLTLHSPLIIEKAAPGQFVMVYLDRGELLLPRPISICWVDKACSAMQLLYQVVGAGTKHLSQLQKGGHVKIVGPLGNGFKINNTPGKVALIGGGVGTPTMLMLLQHLPGVSADVYLGFRSQPVLVDNFQNLTHNVYIATEDGSHGFKGRVTDILIDKSELYNEIYACGPRPMLKQAAEYAKAMNIPCQVCMEERMACGLGTCVGCAIKTKNGYQKVCVDGPVFYGDMVDWNE